MAAMIGPGIGGVPEGIGPIESLAPSPGAGRARVLGLPQALRLTGDFAGPLAQMAINRSKRAKDFNDAEAFDLDGADSGSLVQAAGRSGAVAP